MEKLEELLLSLRGPEAVSLL
uniref:Uncharacterized protein n=1 Tax=Rhizophora mucronata TaxID=61149 RepID=A0A2P2NWQ7_RHIMU